MENFLDYVYNEIVYPDELNDEDSHYSEGYSYAIEVLNFMTLNTGDGFAEDRCKIVIWNKMSSMQTSLLTEWLERRVNEEVPIIVFVNGHQKTYEPDDDNYSSRGIIKSIQRSFLSGILESRINEESIRNGYDKLVYRVDSFSGDKSTFKDKSVFFAGSLEYFDYSDTGYSKEEAKEYYLNLKDFKVFDPMIQWKNDIDVETWSTIRTSEEFANENDLYITDYLDGIDYEDPNVYHEVIIDTDSLAEYGRQNGYDVTILRDIASDGGRGPLFTEYAVHNSNAVKIKDAKVFNKENHNINEEENNGVDINSITEKDVLNAVEKLSDKDDVSYNDFEAIENNYPVLLLTPSGEILNVYDYDTHSQFMDAVFSFLNVKEFESDYEMAYDYVVEKLGFVTLNTGDGYSDNRCKIIIYSRLTQKQVTLLREWIKRRIKF